MATYYSAEVYAGLFLDMTWLDEVKHHIKRCGQTKCVLPEMNLTDADRYCSFCGKEISKVKSYLDLSPFSLTFRTQLRAALNVEAGARIYRDNFMDNANGQEVFPGLRLYLLPAGEEWFDVFFGTVLAQVGQHEGSRDALAVKSWRENVWAPYESSIDRTLTREPTFHLQWSEH